MNRQEQNKLVLFRARNVCNILSTCGLAIEGEPGSDRTFIQAGGDAMIDMAEGYVGEIIDLLELDSCGADSPDQPVAATVNGIQYTAAELQAYRMGYHAAMADFRECVRAAESNDPERMKAANEQLRNPDHERAQRS